MYCKLNDFLKEKFGCKVYKLALSGGMTCPNRDGTLSDNGCIFCGEDGSGFFAESGSSITAQIENAKLKIKSKIKNGKYIAYFQSFTNTYAPVYRLEKIFSEAISHPDIAALSVATRPDCLPEEVLCLLERLNKIKPVFVELGLQTIHESTAEYIRRGYSLPVFDAAVSALKQIGINVVVHMIIGLPGESRQMITETAEYIGKSGADGIKLQLLHVLEGTDLAKDYRQNKFECLTLEEYIDILKECIKVLPKNMVIHRLTGDGAKAKLIAPVWSTDKKHVLNEINAAFEKDGVVQGSLFKI